jgi:4-carboxymuconolactone decarboxylase
VEAIPGYNPHLLADVGALFVATGALMLLAAVWLHRPVVLVALVSWLLFALPHTIYHLANLDVYGTGDAVGNAVTLSLTVLIPVALLALMARAPRAVPRGPAGDARIPLVERPRGAVARGSFSASRRQTGTVVDPVRAFAHHPTLLAGYGALEMAAERSSRVDERTKELVTMRAAMLSGCEWCLDFGSALAANAGVTEEDLRALPAYADNGHFSEAERLALDYATGMTRTPVDVSDELVAHLREHFDDAQMVELTTIIALENLRARFNWALGLGSQGFSEGNYCLRPEPA